MSDYRILPKNIPCDKNLFGAKQAKAIYLRNVNRSQSGGDWFRINHVVGEGSSCVCYNATLVSENKTGRLKEFYPLDMADQGCRFNLIRNSQNHVVSASDEISADDGFIRERFEFTESYRLLRELIEKKRENSDFTNFIPDFTLYYACDENGEFVKNSTVYVWTPAEKTAVFADYIKDIRKNPNHLPEHKLFTVLSTICTLAECIKILHEQGLLHLDIKPGNFGVPKRKEKLLTDTVTLFDVNSFYSLKSIFSRGSGTEGFRAPEVSKGRADNRSDIYSIGCTLFSALVVSDEITSMGFQREYYNQIDMLLENSPLIKASETNSNLYLKWEISNILKKCLATSPQRRYQSCGELINDLRTALTYLYPAEFNASLPEDRKLVILDKQLDKKNPDSGLAFLYHLYKYPLFINKKANSDELNILVVGFGNYGQKFLDHCLQLGQMHGKRLNAIVLSNDKTKNKKDKDFYIYQRPLLNKFFCIDNNSVADSYGNISFVNAEFSEDIHKNRKIIKQFADNHREIDYIFIALGNDIKNFDISKAFCDCFPENCSVNYACEGEIANGDAFANPVYVTRDFTKEKEFKNIQRMAFNAHLVWKGALNVDLNGEKVNFRKPYYYIASISNAIAVKYKLYSVGIDDKDPVSAAMQYNKLILNNAELKNALVSAEHRRWVCDKICDGWTLQTNLEECIHHGTSNAKEKWHICLVPSTSNRVLNNSSYKDCEKWNNYSKAELEKFDALDRVSVKLHRTYKAYADKLKEHSVLDSTYISQIRSLIQGIHVAETAFSDWFACLVLIWNGGAKGARMYDFLKENLLQSLVALESDSASAVKSLIKLLDMYFRPIIKSMEYTDFKDNDANLVNNLPFILTYRTDMHIVVPFNCGNNSDIFGNVSSATVINPAKITYVYHFDSETDILNFKIALSYVLRYMKEKQIRAKLDFIITYNSGVDIGNILGFMRPFERIQNINTFRADSLELGAEYVSARLSRKRIDGLEENKTKLSRELTSINLCDNHPKFSFDALNKKFTTKNCDLPSYIPANQFLRISDMFAMGDSKGFIPVVPEFYQQFQPLWNLYSHNKEAWYNMCRVLNLHSNDNDVFGCFDLKNQSDVCRYRYILPSNGAERVYNILSALKQKGVVSVLLPMERYTAGGCAVVFHAKSGYKSVFEAVMSNPYILMGDEGISLEKSEDLLFLRQDNINAFNVDLGTNPAERNDIKALVKKLSDEFGFIINYQESPCGRYIGFTYATRQIKKLLVESGRILEIYIYHKCLLSDSFDDIVNDYVIGSEDAENNHMDIIATKGFGSIFVHITSQSVISKELLKKLWKLAMKYGINCKVAVVGDNIKSVPEETFGATILSCDKQITDIQKSLLEILN